MTKILCFALVSLIALHGAPALAACPDVVGTTVNCHVGDTVDPNYTAPATTTLNLLGGASAAQTLTFGELHFVNPVLVVTDMTMTTSGFVTGASATPSLNLLEFRNEQGGVILNVGADTKIIGGAQNFVIDVAGRNLLPGKESLVNFNGQLDVDFVEDASLTSAFVVGLRNFGRDSVSVHTFLGATSDINVTAAAAGSGAQSLFGAVSSALGTTGDALVDALGKVTVTGTANTQAGGHGSPGAGMSAFSQSGASTINAGGTVIVDNSAFTGVSAQVAAVRATVGNTSTSAATINLSGSIETFGNFTSGVEVRNAGTGDMNITATAASTVVTHGDGSVGVVAFPNTGGTGNVSIQTGSVTTEGADAPAVAAFSDVGNTSVDTSLGAISTVGDRSTGIDAGAAAGNVIVTTGDVSTAAALTDAVLAQTPTGTVTVNANGAIAVIGDGSRGIAALSLPATGASGAVAVTSTGSTLATGHNSAAILALSSANRVDVQVGTGATVLGGWSIAPDEVDATTGFGAAGILLGGGAANGAFLVQQGSVGALSDQAIRSLQAGPVQITNSGTLTGYFTLGAGDDVFNNTGSVNLREFADVDGNGVRDTKRVAEGSFGAGTDVLRNEATGVVRVMSIAAPTNTETASQFRPAGIQLANYTTLTPGVEQARLTGLERFENRGIITLADMETGGTAPVAGDVLLITSGTVNAAGAFTAGTTPAVFLSDGGRLHLDTVLNEGGVASHSDMLITDSVVLGPNGPTRIFITNAGGLGAATSGGGIKLVDVLGGPGLSAANAFTLGAPVMAGAFVYNLFRSAPLADDGDWYLRTEPPPVIPPILPPVIPPVIPPVTPPVIPPVIPPGPAYRPEAALFASLPGLMRGMDAAVPGSRQERLGDESAVSGMARRGRAWTRVFNQGVDTTQQGTVAPAVSGQTGGLQMGVEFFGSDSDRLAQVGLYAGQIRGDADISGYANGVVGAMVGTASPRSTFVGAYASRARGRGYYYDAVLQYAYHSADVTNLPDGVEAKVKGHGDYASFEGGYGFKVGRHVVIEPQLQVVLQSVRMDDIQILNAGVEQSVATTINARVGLRFRGEFGYGASVFRPYVQGSAWRTAASSPDETTFTGGSASTTLVTETDAETGEISMGMSFLTGRRFMAFVEAKKIFTMGEQSGMTVEGTHASLGMRLSW